MVTYEIDIKKLREGIKEKKAKDQSFDENIFSKGNTDEFITQFELEKASNESDQKQFKADWIRQHGILINFNGKDYHIVYPDPNLDDVALSDLTKTLRENILKKIYPVTRFAKISDRSRPTLQQVDRIVQHYSQKSITSMGIVPDKQNIAQKLTTGPSRLLRLDITNLSRVKISSSNFTAMKNPEDGESKVINLNNFEAEIAKDGKLNNCKLIVQYKNPEDSLLSSLDKESTKPYLKEIDKDISKIHLTSILRLLKVYNPPLNRLKEIISAPPSEFVNKENMIRLLEEGVFDIITPQDRLMPSLESTQRQNLVKLTLEQEDGKEIIEKALTNSMVKYLDQAFSKFKPSELNSSIKDRIANNLSRMVDPLKSVEPIGEVSQLAQKLELRKLVGHAAREYYSGNQSWFKEIKKYCKRAIDSCTEFFNRQVENEISDRSILKAFKENVANASIDHIPDRNPSSNIKTPSR